MKSKLLLSCLMAIPLLCACPGTKECEHHFVDDKGYDATCTTTGLTDGRHCELCGEVLFTQEVIPALGHNPVIDEMVNSTCTEDGLTTGIHCDRCDEIIIAQNVIKHLGHDVVIDLAVEPTCLEHGLTEGSHCKTCGEIINAQMEIPALGHKYKVTSKVDATCTEDGLTEKIECERCNEIIINSEIIEHKGHTLKDVLEVAADCEHEGRSAGVICDTCGEIISGLEKIDPLGHTMVVDNGYDADCTHDGLTNGAHCSKCGKTFVSQQIINHKEHKIVKDAAVEPTCTHEGLTEGSHCELCGLVITEQEVIPATGHTYVFDDEVESTCCEEGKTKGMHCSVCDEVFIEQLPIDKVDHRSGKLVSIPLDSFEGIEQPGEFECNDCHEHYIAEVKEEDLGIPVMSISGDLSEMTKENKVKASAKYESNGLSFECETTMKWQGQSSTAHAKKNYSIQLFEKDSDFNKKYKVALDEKWGKQNKYCLKANYIDYSGIRNIANGKIYGQMARTIEGENEYSNLVNAGAVDGFPIVLYENNAFRGLYTVNIPKDKWLFDMKDDSTTRQAILFARTGNYPIRLKEELNGLYDDGWDLEFASTEEDETIGTDWVADSMNNAIRFLNSATDEQIVAQGGQYFDFDKAIDSLLLTILAQADDNRFHNVMWVTFDGVKWAPTVYDFDGTYGISYNGEAFTPINDLVSDHQMNKLFEKIFSIPALKAKMVQRYKELRENVFSLSNLERTFMEMEMSIPGVVYAAEKEKWFLEPNQDLNNAAQITDYLSKKLAYIDSRFGVTISEPAYQKITFTHDETVEVTCYATSDYSKRCDLWDTYYARNGDTGLLEAGGDGQCNFYVKVQEGYEITGITINGSYKNLKGKSDTLIENLYRITKIKSDLEVVIETQPIV